MTIKIQDMKHPDYTTMLALWGKYRCVFQGGQIFINKYLKSFSSREDHRDFNTRKELSYAPSHAKAALMELKNAIFQRMPDIKRSNGTQSYNEAIAGRNKGVDFNGNTMDSFIGRLVLPDLLSIGKVGIYVDRHPLPEQPSKADVQARPPYLYTYRAEDIRSWALESDTQLLTHLLLHDTIDEVDKDTGLVTGTTSRFRLLEKTTGGIRVSFFDKDSKPLDGGFILSLAEIPFVLFELSHSLLTDIADHQIALLNLASSDMNYAIKGNFPFYVEQYDPIAEQAYLRQAIDEQSEDNEPLGEGTAGEAEDAATAKNPAIRTGVAQGRRYSLGTESPRFIAPPTAPLEASMEKQEQIKREILQLVNLAVSTLRPARASAESKREDQKGLEAGLSYIGVELSYGERQIQQIWADYENEDINPSVAYPQYYSLRTEESRRKEAKELLELMPKLPSKISQKELAKEAAEILLGHRITDEQLQTVRKQIDNAKVIVIDPEVISMDLENGLVSAKTASKARLYPEGDFALAQKEHAERAAAIVAAQAGAAARGNPDGDPDPKASGADEKTASRNTDLNVDQGDKTRGRGQ